MKSLILKTTTLALGAALVLSTAAVGTAEARHGHRGHHFRHHGHHHHHFHRHFYRPYYYNYQYSSCFWRHGKYVCPYKW